ncbi:MAG: hypothetical protein WC868_05125 [Bacteroidales bacterium]
MAAVLALKIQGLLPVIAFNENPYKDNKLMGYSLLIKITKL